MSTGFHAGFGEAKKITFVSSSSQWPGKRCINTIEYIVVSVFSKHFQFDILRFCSTGVHMLLQ